MGKREESELDLAVARTLISNGRLWPHVRDFLWDFAPSVHPSWLEKLEGFGTADAGCEDESRLSLVSRLISSLRIKQYLLDQLHVEPCFHSFPVEDGSRLVLLDAATLDSVARWLGVLSSAAELRTVTDGPIVRVLKAAFPGVYPDAFSFLAYFQKEMREWKLPPLQDGLEETENRERRAEQLVSRVLSRGYALLASRVSALPKPLLHRLRLKLPVQTPFPSEPVQVDGVDETALRAVIEKLFKFKFPEAHQLCFS